MGYLFFSVQYPSVENRKRYINSVPSNFKSATFQLYQPLSASADIEAWQALLKVFKKVCPESVLDHTIDRPVRPNDDNYVVFVGPQWKTNNLGPRELPMELAGFANNDEPIPHYDRCAMCTAPDANKRCSRCKIVRYCTVDCQKRHWGLHRKSCIKAPPNHSLWQALQTNDGFLITAEECAELASGFDRILASQSSNLDSFMKDLGKGFSKYFQCAAELGGCFVL